VKIRAKNVARAGLKGLEWCVTLSTKQWCKALKGEHCISEKKGLEATTSISFPNIRP